MQISRNGPKMNKNLHAKFAAESSRPISASGRKMMEAWSVHTAGRKERVAAAAINPHCRQADPGTSILLQENRQIPYVAEFTASRNFLWLGLMK